MADFKKAWAKTSKAEGGYCNLSLDKGKETYRGIARAFWGGWIGWDLVDKVKIKLHLDNTVDGGSVMWKKIDLELMMMPEMEPLVDSFYKRNFWDLLKLDEEAHQSVAEKVFDIAVNIGTGPARTFYDEAKKAA